MPGGDINPIHKTRLIDTRNPQFAPLSKWLDIIKGEPDGSLPWRQNLVAYSIMANNKR